MNRGGCLAALLVLAAGCTGAGGPAADASDPAATRATGSLEVAVGTADVEGFVTDEEARPVPGANVSLGFDGWRVSTDAQGFFAFRGVLAADYALLVAAAGFEPFIEAIRAFPDVAVRLFVTLVSVPHPEVAYTADLTWRGYIGCAVGWSPAQTGDYCQALSPDPAVGRVESIPFEAGLTSAVWELRWTSTHLLSAQSLLGMLELYPGVSCEGVGPSPVVVSCPFGEDVTAYIEDLDNRTAELYVWPSPGDGVNVSTLPTEWWQGASGLVTQQPFDAYMTLFYWGAAVPAGYRPSESGG